MQLTVTLPVQPTVTYELKQQQKHLQPKTVYAIIGRVKGIMLLLPIISVFGDIVINNLKANTSYLS